MTELPRALANPYGAWFAALPPFYRREPGEQTVESPDPIWQNWKAAVARSFAWAVPTDEAIGLIAKTASRVIEIGAGSGYWAWMLRQAGVDVLAFDTEPAAISWHRVLRGDASAVAYYPDRALFLCWPPYGTGMATTALETYRGNKLIYVGEWRLGCGEPALFDAIERDWSWVAGAALPNWRGRYDAVAIFRRNPA